LFYDAPRFVTHIDDAAIASLTSFYSETFPSGENVALLDLCSSWISHYPKDLKARRVIGLGMNADELRKNSQLTDFVVRDLNQDPSLPFEDDAFDVVTNCVSVDYLTKPFQVFTEMARVTKVRDKGKEIGRKERERGRGVARLWLEERENNENACAPPDRKPEKEVFIMPPFALFLIAARRTIERNRESTEKK